LVSNVGINEDVWLLCASIETIYVLVGGVDEAGRGPVIGPMVLVLAVIDESKLGKLEELEVKDSKELSPERREELYPEIVKLLDDLVIVKILPAEIDAFVEGRGGLNELEALKTAQMVTQAKKRPEILYVDAPDPNPAKYVQRIERYLQDPPRIIAENGADAKYPIVSAASIVAKVERDREVKKIEERYGSFGTGYPHDDRTVHFLENLVQKNGGFPGIVRKSWSTAKRILERGTQRSILDW